MASTIANPFIPNQYTFKQNNGVNSNEYYDFSNSFKRNHHDDSIIGNKQLRQAQPLSLPQPLSAQQQQQQQQQRLIKKIAIVLKRSSTKIINKTSILLDNHTTNVLEKLLHIKLGEFLFTSYDDEPCIPVLSKILKNNMNNICFIQKLLHNNQKDYSIVTLTFMKKDHSCELMQRNDDFYGFDIKYSLIYSTLGTPPHSCTVNKLQNRYFNLFEGNMFHLPCLLNFCDHFNTTDINTYSVRKDIISQHPIYGNSSFLDTKNDGHVQHFKIISMEVCKIETCLDET